MSAPARRGPSPHRGENEVSRFNGDGANPASYSQGKKTRTRHNGNRGEMPDGTCNLEKKEINIGKEEGGTPSIISESGGRRRGPTCGLRRAAGGGEITIHRRHNVEGMACFSLTEVTMSRVDRKKIKKVRCTKKDEK